ncbi:MAG: ATP phosphoribosyltransferase, partial [Anaerolineae bacterium]|nr:ATP phosphoribosyltransferase [Anaerolineae bacterium]
ALHGRGYYQVVANIRGTNPESVAQLVASHAVTRGLQGPTIAPIYAANGGGTDNQWYTATIIVESKHLLPAVEHLRSIGGTQTIVSPVRYIFLENSPTFMRLQSVLNGSPS